MNERPERDPPPTTYHAEGRRRARQSRKGSRESIYGMHAPLWYFIFARGKSRNVCKTTSRDSKRANSVVTSSRRARSWKGMGWRPHTDTKGMGREEEEEEEIMFHVETLREDLVVCCSNIRSLCLMRFLLYRGLGSTDDLFLDGSRPRSSERKRERFASISGRRRWEVMGSLHGVG